MRVTAESKPHPATVRFVDGSANRIPLDDTTADLVFMSQVVHHILDPTAALREIRRVLRPEGRLCLRQTTRENLASYFYQQFFPEARAVDERRLPSRSALMNLAQSCHYRMVAMETLSHEIAATSDAYVEKIALRAYSDLECISDEAFRNGLSHLRGYAAASPDFPRFVENDLFIFAA
jgi:ubiquinone/menaquinone biosynthesis C-methylase UbiE